MRNLFGDSVFYDRGMQREEMLMFYWVVEKRTKLRCCSRAADFSPIIRHWNNAAFTVHQCTVYSKTFSQKEEKKKTNTNQKTK